MLPTPITSPSRSSCSPTIVPFTVVPFVEPRSTTRKPSGPRRTCACWRDDLRIGERHRAVGEAPDRRRLVGERNPPAVGQDERGGPPALALLDGRLDPQVALAALRVFGEVDRDRPDEVIVLVAGVLAGGVGELARERVAERREALGVGRRQHDREVVRRDDAVHTDRASGVELLHEPSSDLERLEPAAERLGERAFDEPLEASLEGLETHRSECRWRCFEVRSTSATGEARDPAGNVRPLTREWRNWQTRRIQVPVPARAWGFKSPLAHPSRRIHRRSAARWSGEAGSSHRAR